MSVETKEIEKIWKSEETEETEEQKPKRQHEPLHTETWSTITSFFHRSRSLSDERYQHFTSDLFEEAIKGSKSLSSTLNKWCIYRIPSKLRNVNQVAYTPQLLSIGLFHYGKPKFKDMDKHKEIYTQNFYKRDWKGKVELSPNEKAVRLKNFIELYKDSTIGCYAGTIDINMKGNKDDKLVEIILFDACFIIELFLRNCETEYYDKDYILSSPWLRKAVELELILFENQLPYSLLEELYKFASPASSSSRLQKEGHKHECTIHIDKAKPVQTGYSFLDLTCMFLKDFIKGNLVQLDGVRPKHFTDVVRHFMCPNIKEENWVATENSTYSTRMLTAAGVDFVPAKDAYFVLKIDDSEVPKCMKLKLTPFRVKDDTECIIRNVMALELFVYPDKAYVCNYFMMMDKLVDTVEDVDFLVEKKVIDNMLGSNQEVAQLLNKLCNHIMEEKSCYTDICNKLNTRYESSLNRHLVTLKRVYFKDVWTGSATFFGVVLVLLTIIEIIMSFKK